MTASTSLTEKSPPGTNRMSRLSMSNSSIHIARHHAKIPEYKNNTYLKYVEGLQVVRTLIKRVMHKHVLFKFLELRVTFQQLCRLTHEARVNKKVSCRRQIARQHSYQRNFWPGPGCASGCVVKCRICNREVAGSNLGLGHFASRSTQPSIPPGSVNEYQLRLGRQRQVWLIPIADERVGVQVKL